jgi:hypothetical protein
MKNLVELKFESYLKRSDKFKELNMEYISKNSESITKKGQIEEKNRINNSKNSKLIFANFSSFSNITNKKQYYNLINNIKNVDLVNIRDIIFEENNLKNKNKFYTTNAKILVLSELSLMNKF